MRKIRSTMLMIALAGVGFTSFTTLSTAAPDGDGRPAIRADRGGGGEKAFRGSPQDRVNRSASDSNFKGDNRRKGDVRVQGDRGRAWNGPGHRDRIRRGHRYAWGPGISFYLSDGYYYGDCGWLKRRAIETGSRVWWRRYERCRIFD